MNDYAPRPTSSLVSRRWLLSRLPLGAAIIGTSALGLSACSQDSVTELFSTNPSPNELLQTLAAQLSAAGNSSPDPAMSAFLNAQSELVTQEVLRQCGVDNQGNPPASCTKDFSLHSPPADPEVAYMDLITTAAQDMPADVARYVEEQFPLVVGLYAAFATTQAQPNPGAVALLEKQAIAEGLKTAAEQLAKLVEFAHAAIYAAGLAMAHAGSQVGIYSSVAARLRELRDAAMDALQNLSQGVPEAAAGYSLPPELAQPTDSASSAAMFHAVLIPITRQLRLIAVQADTVAAREWVARWCGLIARGEAAMERIQGTNPLDITVRGA